MFTPTTITFHTGKKSLPNLLRNDVTGIVARLYTMIDNEALRYHQRIICLIPSHTKSINGPCGIVCGNIN